MKIRLKSWRGIMIITTGGCARTTWHLTLQMLKLSIWMSNKSASVQPQCKSKNSEISLVFKFLAVVSSLIHSGPAMHNSSTKVLRVIKSCFNHHDFDSTCVVSAERCFYRFGFSYTGCVKGFVRSCSFCQKYHGMCGCVIKKSTETYQIIQVW